MTSLPWISPFRHLMAAAVRTPSGAPPVPMTACTPVPTTAAEILADVWHGRLVPLALTDHDRAVDVDALHLLAHRLDRHLVGVLAVSLAHGAGGGHGRPLHHPHELQEQVVSMHGLFPLNAEDAEVTERARRKES